MRSYVFLTISALICDPRLLFAFEVEPSIAVLVRKYAYSDWKLIEDRSELRANVSVDRKQARIFRKVKTLHETFEELERPLLSVRFNDMVKIIKSTPIDRLLYYMWDLDYNFEQLVQYSSRGEDVPIEDDMVDASTLIGFSKTVTSHQPTSMKGLMNTIHNIVAPATRYNELGLFKWLANKRDIHDKLVRTMHQSPQQLLYNLFNKIALAQIKGYVTTQMCYTMLTMYNQGTFWRESQLAKQNFQNRTKAMLNEFKAALVTASREYWRHDPKEYKSGENYLEITRLMQGYVVNERVLSKGRGCYGQCEKFKEENIANCQNDRYCRMQRRCSGKVYDCRNLKTTGMNICPAAYGSTRRYEYIQFDDNTVLGENSKCKVSMTLLSGSIGWCPYCMCSCDDEGYYSDRYFSLKRAISDTTANKVVTGVRFVKQNRIIHLQVQQGELLPYGLVNDTTLEWAPVNSFKLTDRYVHDKAEYAKLGRKRNAIDLHVKEVDNRDRRFPKRVITGLRFSLLKTQVDMHLNLEIRETAFDFNTGKLFLNSNQWTKNIQTQFSNDDKRTPIYIRDVDLPTRTRSENIVKSRGVQYIEFTQTSMEKDAAQTTVPFIDVQEVVPSVPTPLVGAGVYYKAAEGYGGFIGLKIVTYDFTEHL